MDDILIFSKDLEEHRNSGQKGVTTTRREDLFFKTGEMFFRETIHQISRYGSSAAKIRSRWIPLNFRPYSLAHSQMFKDIQSFLGFGNFYWRFIQGFANITAPLTSLTQKDTTWHWDDDQQTAFETLKQWFTSAPILLCQIFSKPFRLETDALDYNYGAILSQQSEDGHWLPVAYMSKQMLLAERNYVIYDKELLAIIEALKLWHHYLEGNPHPNRNLVRSQKSWILSFGAVP